MFHTWPVKIAKIAAHSTPSRLPGNNAMKAVTVADRKPSTGTDCSTSRAGKITARALLFLAARYPVPTANTSEKQKAIHMRSSVRPA